MPHGSFCCVTALLGVLSGACSASSTYDASATVTVSTQSLPQAADVTRVQLTISAPDIAQPIVENLANTAGVWEGTIGGIPAGTNRTFSAGAYDASSALIFAGQASPVTITNGEQASVTIALQQAVPPAPYTEQVPVIDSFIASTATPHPGAVVTLSVTAHDANPDDAITFTWLASAGTFSDPWATSTTWTAPATAGPQTVTVQVTDANDETATKSLTMQVGP
jgi:hypothetical protein